MDKDEAILSYRVKREDAEMLDKLSTDFQQWFLNWVADYIVNNGLPGSKEPKGLLSEGAEIRRESENN